MTRVSFSADSKPEAIQSIPRPRTQSAQREIHSVRQASLFKSQLNWTIGLLVWFLSQCSVPPATLPEHKSRDNACWHPPTFSKAVVVIIDALRYDFTVPQNDTAPYHNALTVMHEMAASSPQNSFLLPFIADPPTTTLQRIKGLTTGTLPTFMDAGSNFAGTAIDDDNLLSQMLAQNRTLVHLGDDTWHALFPNFFEPNLTRPYDSFQVWDLFTVDNGVTEHIIPYLQIPSRWDFMVGHYLGVDHAGHRYGPDHPQMTLKLKEMDTVIREMINNLPDDTLLVIFGDHGMDPKGDHGGDTDDEVEAALWMYSKKPVFGRTSTQTMLPPPNAKTRPVAQIDLVPTLALLLGLPIPFSNLGSPIAEAFIGPNGDAWDNLAKVNMLTAAQIRRYQAEYAQARGADAQVQAEPNRRWKVAEEDWQVAVSETDGTSKLRKSASSWKEYMAANLEVCKSLWANFDIPSMMMGIVLLAATLAVFLRFALSRRLETLNSKSVLGGVLLGAVAGCAVGFIISIVGPPVDRIDMVTLMGALGSLAGALLTWQRMGELSVPLPSTLWSYTSVFVTLSPAIGFASNSYTIWEDEMLLFFLGTFGLLATCSSFRQRNNKERALGVYHSVLFMLLTRIASFSRLCREEQGALCRSTYYASENTSTPAVWHLAISYITVVLLPLVIRTYFDNTGSFVGVMVPWIKFAFAPGLALTAIYWTLNAADDGQWIEFADADMIGNSKRSIALLVIFTAFVVGLLAFISTVPPLSVEDPETSAVGSTGGRKLAISVSGLNNLHGSRYSILVTSFLLGILVLQKPMGGGAMAIMGWQIFSLLEIINTNRLRNSSIGPVALALMGNFYFFKTGHQATLQSIQWDIAFVPLKTIRYPWSPLVVILNTWGPQMLAAIAVPLLIIWRREAKAQGLLKSVVRAGGTHIGYYAVLNLFTVMWTGHLRRHLMLYKIFSPRFMTGAALLILVEIVTIIGALLGFKINTLSVAGLFGWP